MLYLGINARRSGEMTAEKEYLIKQIEKINTTDLRIVRIKRNLNLAVDIDAISSCKNLLQDPKSVLVR
jgi:hypothetical protein